MKKKKRASAEAIRKKTYNPPRKKIMSVSSHKASFTNEI